MRKIIIGGICICAAVIYVGYQYLNRPSVKIARFADEWTRKGPTASESDLNQPLNTSISAKVLQGAKQCVEQGAVYTPGYFKIGYPMGDVPLNQGVCTDVVIRSFRNAGIDLQELIHEDMIPHFKSYPQLWGLSKPDTNIDHRRIPNLMYFFNKYGVNLACEVNDNTLNQWQAADIVFWRLDEVLLHCGIVSNRRNKQGIPYVIHNLGITAGTDCLTNWRIIGHFRYPK